MSIKTLFWEGWVQCSLSTSSEDVFFSSFFKFPWMIGFCRLCTACLPHLFLAWVSIPLVLFIICLFLFSFLLTSLSLLFICDIFYFDSTYSFWHSAILFISDTMAHNCVFFARQCLRITLNLMIGSLSTTVWAPNMIHFTDSAQEIKPSRGMLPWSVDPRGLKLLLRRIPLKPLLRWGKPVFSSFFSWTFFSQINLFMFSRPGSCRLQGLPTFSRPRLGNQL